MSGIHVPIDYSNIKEVIPPGEDIIYSTLCKGFTNQRAGKNTYTWSWECHVLMTPEGVAYSFPNLISGELKPVYRPWHEFYTILSVGAIGRGLYIEKQSSLKLIRDKNFETNEKFKERSQEFIANFRPLLIKKKEDWLESNRNTLDKKELKKYEKTILKMKDKESKRLLKEQEKENK